ncbi:MAG: hypothetical protein V4751_05585 [Pseudomonadota bacterium]
MLKFFNKKVQSTGLVGLSISDEKISLAQISRRISRDSAAPFLEKCAQLELSSPQQTREILSRYVEGQELKGAPCNYVLTPKDYNLYLIESPPVEPQEMKSAVRWKIKDLLDMPAEDAAIDIFPVPEDAFQGRSKMLYVVAAQKSRIQSIIELVSRCDLSLSAIDIPELAMRNMSSQFLSDEHGLAFMDLRKTGSTLNMSRAGQLYLTRKINTQLDNNVMDSPDWESLRDRLVLEIQRSLDYYESQMAQNPISQMVLAPRVLDSQQMVDSLNEVMAVKVSLLDYASRLDHAEGIEPQLQQSCMVAIGAALRADQAAVSA